ncbi:hypothetical protein [Corynebacterium liangguodongii]|uniref:Uncharacterized protein n=1 Tax=Corynebacterium liangguodongii TaxID=2079535 RepID=A0A2S0WCF4_9CORY|nr:hypothetical protein [Corynebacterium liangguodongii]AWB83362.1 hypothetical protein C3E79_01725 [Corynebacterium liangguodongii]PWC00548.1 hypothetical protein DF219_01225 [Corynebacterium liangguodongii]
MASNPLNSTQPRNPAAPQPPARNRNKALIGIAAGVIVAFFVTFGGWPGVAWLLLFSAIGGVVGAQLDGRIDIAEAIATCIGRGRS